MKKLSIVIFSKNKLASAVSLVKSLLKNGNLNIEVLVIDTSSDNTIDFLYKQFFDKVSDGSLKLFSYKKIRPSQARLDGLDALTGENVWYIYAPDKIKLSFLETAIDVLDAIKPDIMEFNVEHAKSSVLTFRPEKIDILKKIINVQKTPDILASTSPFLYSKIFKTSFLRKNRGILEYDSYFDSLYNYILVSMAKTYYYIDFVGIVVKPQIIHSNIFNLLTTQWNLIINYFMEYTNWNITKRYVEYMFVSYIYKILLPIINKMNIDSIDKYNKHKFLISKVSKAFPNYKVNKYIINDVKLSKLTNTKDLEVKSLFKSGANKNKTELLLDEVENE